MVNKKKPGSQKGTVHKRPSQNVDADDNPKLVDLKDLVKRKVAGYKSGSEKPDARPNFQGINAKNSGVRLGAELRSPEAMIKIKYGAASKSRSSTSFKIGAGDDAEEKALGNEENKSPPMKRRRGADEQIVQAYLSSAEKDLSKFRPRKEVPAFRVVELDQHDNYRIVGKRVKIYWSGSRRWFTGRIQSFERQKKLHNILYDDGDREILDLSRELFELEIMPSEGFKLRVDPKSQKKVAGLDGLEADLSISDAKSSTVGIATNVTESSETQKRRALEKVDIKESLDVKKNNTKVKEGKESVSVEDVVELHQNVIKLLADGLSTGKEAGKLIFGQENGGLEAVADIFQEASKLSDAKTGGLELHSEVKMDLLDYGDCDEGNRGAAVRDDLSEKGATKLVKKYASSRRKGTSSAGKRGPKSVKEKASKETKRVDAEMDADVHPDEDKKYCNTNIEQAMEGNFLKGNNKTEFLVAENTKDHGAALLEAQAATSSHGAAKSISLEDTMFNGNADKVTKQERTEVESKDPATMAGNVEIAVLAGGEAEKKVSIVSIEVPPDLQLTAPKNPEEGSLGILQQGGSERDNWRQCGAKARNPVN